MTVELHARGWENFLFATGLMDEAGVPWKPSGGNVLRVPDDVFERMSGEQLRELAAVVRNPIEVPEPVSDAQTPADASPGAPAGPEGDAAPEVAAPPRSGAGASRDAWAAYAGQLGLTVPADMSRDDIIAMVDQQEAPDAG